MDLKCLVKLLVEKEYIKKVCESNVNGKTILMSFECKIGFEEIYEKIINSDYDNHNIVIHKTCYGANQFYILNISNLEEGLISIGGNRERFGFRADHHRLACVHTPTLRDIITQRTRFSIIRQDFKGQVYFELRDNYIRDKRINDEKNKEDEIIDFLNQLP